MKTYQERRRWFKDIEEECTWRKGRRNTNYLDPWGYNMETYPSCYTSKSWKKLNRVKHQWEKINSKTYY